MIKYKVGDVVIRHSPKDHALDSGIGEDLLITDVKSFIFPVIKSSNNHYYMLENTRTGSVYSAWEDQIELAEVVRSPLYKALA